VKKNSRASKEIAIGDMILKVGRNVVNSVSDYRLMIKEYEKGDSILLLIKRNGASRFVAIDF
jgi:S1-C subfamily serine protease